MSEGADNLPLRDGAKLLINFFDQRAKRCDAGPPARCGEVSVLPADSRAAGGCFAVSEPICPFNDGRHKRVMTEWGQTCMACHKTWEWRDKALVPTWDLHEAARALEGMRS